MESLSSRMDQIENRMSGAEDKVEELKHTGQEHEFYKIPRKNMKGLWGTRKRSNLPIIGRAKREESQTSCTDQSFHKVL